MSYSNWNWIESDWIGNISAIFYLFYRQTVDFEKLSGPIYYKS